MRAAKLAAIAAKAGVTRVSDLTGLDRLDIPVAQAVRPMGKSLSTSMGKGADFEAASIGAMMEAIEVFCAEELPKTAIRSTCEARDGPADAETIDAADLVTGDPAVAPYNWVSLDYTRSDDLLNADSNGLASGATTSEALRAAVCEVVERDRLAKWLRLNPVQKSKTRVCLETVENRNCRNVFSKIEGGGCTLLLWDASATGHLPVYVAAILDRYQFNDVLPPAFGAAARLDPAMAAIAAVGEAAQTRAALISGARDDLDLAGYLSASASHGRISLETLAFLPATRPFAETPVASHGDAEGDVAWLTDKLTADGVGQLLWVDLTREELGVPVVKVIAPDLEGFSTDLTAWQRSQ